MKYELQVKSNPVIYYYAFKKKRQRQHQRQQNHLCLRNFYQPLTPLIEESNTVDSNTSYTGVLRKRKYVTVFGDSMISQIKLREFKDNTKENFILKTFRGATNKDMLSYVQPTLKREKFRCNPDTWRNQ